jgi:hypothetical protein
MASRSANADFPFSGATGGAEVFPGVSAGDADAAAGTGGDGSPPVFLAGSTPAQLSKNRKNRATTTKAVFSNLIFLFSHQEKQTVSLLPVTAGDSVTA